MTIRIPEERLADYFDTFTKRFLLDGSPEALDVEVLEPELGDQLPTTGARLLGITFDRDTGTLEFEFSGGDHRVLAPLEVWVRPDGAREIVRIQPVGLRKIEQA